MPRSQKWRMRRSNEPRQTDAGGGFASVRGAYEQIGPDEFYTQHGLQYSNPHGAVLESTLREALTTWTDLVVAQKRLRVLDIACGGGEASLALEGWWRTRLSSSGGGSSGSGGGSSKRDGSSVGLGTVAGQRKERDGGLDGLEAPRSSTVTAPPEKCRATIRAEDCGKGLRAPSVDQRRPLGRRRPSFTNEQ